MKESGLYDNLVIVFYGDYYGVLNFRNKNLVELVGKMSFIWINYDNV